MIPRSWWPRSGRSRRPLAAMGLAGLRGLLSSPALEAQAGPGPVTPTALERLAGLAQRDLASLRDQFDQRWAMPSATPKGMILLLADRAGAIGLRQWLDALRRHAAPALTIVAAADVAGAPRLLRGMIRQAFPKDTSVRILLDWDGRVSRIVRQAKDESLVAVVFGADGTVKERLVLSSGPVADDTLARLVRLASSEDAR